MTSPRKHLTYANVVATLALIVAVAGIPSAIAITSKLKKNSVGTKQIKKGAITADKIANGNVTATKLAGTYTKTEQVSGGFGASVACLVGDRLLAGGGSGNQGIASLSVGPFGIEVSPVGPATITIARALCLRNTPGG